MEVYASMIDQMDQGIGRLVKALETRAQLDNTLIFFCRITAAAPKVVVAVTSHFHGRISQLSSLSLTM